MKYKCLRWDFLNSIHGRLQRNVDFLKGLPEDHELKELLVPSEIQLLEVVDAMEHLRKLEKQKDGKKRKST